MSYQLTIEPLGQVIEVEEGQTILDASLRAGIYLRDMAAFAAMNQVWDAWVASGHAPARATVEAALATPDYQVEIVITAALP